MVGTLLAAAALVQSPQPSVVLSTLLEATLTFNNDVPTMRFFDIQAVFVPQGSHEAKLVLKRDGQLLEEIEMQPTIERRGALAEYTPRTGSGRMFGEGDGPRSIEFHIDGKVAGLIEFNLTSTTTDDPFDPKTTWQIDGPWIDHAYLKHFIGEGRRPDVSVTFWLSQHEMGADLTAPVQARLRRGDTILAQTYEMRGPERPGILRLEEDLFKPDGSPFLRTDLAAINGPYTLEITHAGQPVKSWDSQIVDGAFVPNPRSATTGVPPTQFLSPRFIEGFGVSDELLTWLTPPPPDETEEED